MHEDDPLVFEMDVLKHGDAPDSWFGTTWTEVGSTGLRVSEWLIRNFQWYLKSATRIVLKLPDDEALRKDKLNQIASGFDRQSQFGPFLILESINCFVAYRSNSDSKKLQVFFAKEVEFSNLPAWIVENSG